MTRTFLFLYTLVVLTVGCATVPPRADAEPVGQLAATTDHVYRAPVHATTDLSPGFQAIDTDEDAPSVDAAPAPSDAEAPEVTVKHSGGF